MSHFCVAVHVPAHNENFLKDSEHYLEQVLMPWHEYECTGIENEYVMQVDITKEVIDDFLKLHEAWYIPGEHPQYLTRYDFKDDELDERPLTEEEKQQIKDRTYKNKEREVKAIPQSCPGYSANPIAILSIPKIYVKTEVANCHKYDFETYVSEFNSIHTVVHNLTETPATGPYIYTAHGVNLGPFDISIPLDEIRKILTENTRVYDYTNPNSKWDWWVVGGRFYLTTKDGKPCDAIQIKDLRTFNPDNRKYAELIWNHYIEGIELTKEQSQDDPFLFWGISKEDLLYFPSKEAYIEDYCKWRPYAYVKDGIWHEPGEMGWWACSSSTPESQKEYNDGFDKMIEECDPEDWLICVDCHI